MNKRDVILNTVNDTATDYTPAAFFMHFRPNHIEGQAAIDKHLEYFKATGMDMLKIQFEQILPRTVTISKPEDWANVPPCPADYFEPTLHIVRELVKVAKAEALVIMTLYSPFMWLKFLTDADTVYAHFRENPEAMKKGLEIFTDYVLTLVRACKQAGVDGFYTSTQGGEAFRFGGTNIFQDYIKPSDLVVWAELKDDPVSILHVCDYHGAYEDFSPFVDYPGRVVNSSLHTSKEAFTPKQVSDLFKRPFMGGLDRLDTIANGDSDSIRRVVTDLLADVPDQFILGADCTVPDNTPWENLKIAIDTAHQYRR